ncbi:hypothetical protein VaNZ11_002785 [Volvox africanus]|uniref:Uncharacterized protein n=1 Tax=Volvox africanus TaxID=51714 RepID=A0ABQ5RTJ0_9CHLO|nr:hypothetical protein VaNZ11_002785 [Volvox africanus]
MEPTKPFEKMTVAELKAELKARGLSEKGVKAELLARLQEAEAALEQEPAAVAADTAMDGQPDPAISTGQPEPQDTLKAEPVDFEADDKEQPTTEAEAQEEQAEEQDADAGQAGADTVEPDSIEAPTEAEQVAPEPEEPVEQEIDKVLADTQLDPSDAPQAAAEPAKEPDYGPEEWETMEIPEEYRPLPVLRVRNIKQEAKPEDVKKVFEDAGIPVHSVDFDNVERNKNVALLRLQPPPLSWKLSKELGPNPLDEALKKYIERKEQEAKAAAIAQKAAEAAAAGAAAEELVATTGSAEAKEEATEVEASSATAGEKTNGAAVVPIAATEDASAADIAEPALNAEAAVEHNAVVVEAGGEDPGKTEAAAAEMDISAVAGDEGQDARPPADADRKPAATSGGSQPAASTPSRHVSSSHAPVTLHVEDGRLDGDVLKVARYTAMRLNALQYPLTLFGDRLMIDAPSLQCTLYLGNVTQDNDEQLKVDMAALGRVIRCFIMRGASGSSKGYAFVEYATPAEALKAKESLEAQSRKAFQDMMATKNDLQRQRGRPATSALKPATPVEEGKEAQGDQGGEAVVSSDKLEGEKVAGLEDGKGEPDTQMKDQDEAAAVEGAETGSKERAPEEEAAGMIKLNVESDPSADQEEQPKVVEGSDEGANDTKDLQSKQPSHTSKIMRAELTHIRRAQDLFSRNLYLASLPMSLSDEGVLRKVFGEFGPVIAASITRGPQGYSKGFGFIEFLRSDHAAAAQAALDGKEVPTLGKLAISFVNPSKSTDRRAGPQGPGGRGGPQGLGGRYGSTGGPGRGGMMTPGFRAGPHNARNAPYFAGPGRSGYMQPPPPPPYGISPMMRNGPGPFNGHGRGGMLGPGRGYGGGYGIGGMGMGGGYGGYGGGMMGRNETGGGGYGGGYGGAYGGYGGSRGGQQQQSSSQGPRSGMGYGAGVGAGGNSGTAGTASPGYGSSSYSAGNTAQQQQQAIASPTASAGTYQGAGYSQGTGTYGGQASQSQYASQSTGYGSQVTGYGSQSGYGSQTSGYANQSSTYGGQQQNAQAASGYSAQQQQQQSTYGNQQAAAGTYPTSYSAPAQTYGANGYSGTAAQVPSSTYTAPSTTAGYGAQQSTTGYGTQQQQAATTVYPGYSSAAQAYGATGAAAQQQTGYGAATQTNSGYGQQAQQQGSYGAGASYGASAGAVYTGYGQAAGYGASTQQASGAYGGTGVSYGQQAQQAYGTYGQQTSTYSAQAYGQQQVGQKRDGDAYASYGAGYGADYKRPRY